MELEKNHVPVPKVIIICGKICSGKSTYAGKIKEAQKAIILSVDEIMLALFNQNVDDSYVTKAKSYLYKKSLEILDVGISVILDWGFWAQKEREYAKKFYASKNIKPEFHYLDVDCNEWQNRINKRNKDLLENKVGSYYVDKALISKCKKIFEEPKKHEIDVWVRK